MNKVENMTWEILDALKDAYCDGTKEGKEVMSAICYFLYTMDDDTMKEACAKMLGDLGYCLECGSELQSYHYKEYHEEVDAYETMFATLCPCCDRDEIMEMK